MQQVSILQEYFPKDWSGLTSRNHLSAIYAIEPQNFTSTVTQLYQVNYGADLEAFLRGFGVKKFKTDDDFRWMLQGRSNKNIPLVAAYIDGTPVTGSSMAGLANTTFELEFPEPYFSSEIIVGEYNELYPIQIISGPVSTGTNYLYTCQLFTGDPSLFIPYDQIIAGKRFSKEWAIRELSMSVDGGNVNYTSPFSLRNAFSFIRMEDTRPGNMVDRPVAWSWKVMEGGKEVTKTTWSQYADWELERQFREQKSKLMMFATTNKSADGTYKQKGKSGNVIQQGSGIRQQMSPSNTYFYNTFDIDWLTDCMMQLTVGKIKQDQRKVVLRTGEWGMLQFHKSLQDFASVYRPLFDTSRVKMDSDNAMTFRGQYLKYIGPNGIEVELQHEPMYDDPERNKIMHPSGRGFAESYTYDILNIGTSNGQPNIQTCYVEGSEDIYGYEAGLRHPFTLGNSKNMMTTRVDGYTIHRASCLGAAIIDPTRTARIVPSMLRP